MSSAVRFYVPFYVWAIVASVGLAGCTPAAFVQRARLAPACDIKVCTTIGTGTRCECKTFDQLVRQTRHGFWPHAE